MTDRLHDSDHPSCGEDLAAYALGALDEAEAAAMRRHLETCAVCQDELASFRRVVDVLPLTAPALRAPRGLRRRVLRQAAAETAQARRAGTSASGTAVGRRPRWRTAPALALGAALAAAAVVVGIRLSSGAPSAHVYRAQVVGRGTAELRVNGGHGELVVHGFAPPPAGEIYEVWLKRPGSAPAPTSALFSVTAAGSGDVVVPGSLRHVALVMVTPEPDGGTKVPTHPPVISVTLT